MSLAEELLADFDDDDDVEDLEEYAQVKKEEEEDDEIEEATEEPQELNSYRSVFDVAKLAKSEKYQRLVLRLREEIERPADEVKVTAPLEADPQYRLIVDLSNLVAEIDSEINTIHKFVRDKYEKRFPELETLVSSPLDYLATVQLLGNDISSKAQNKDLLNRILPPATCIVVSVTVSTTQGTKLEPEELAAVIEACDLAEQLHNDRIQMHQLIEIRMALIAPNLVALLGASTTALLVSQAGGLCPLARMPACNVQVLGRQKKNLAGFSSTIVNPHHGFVYFHPLVQSMPPDFKSKMAKILAAKATLAARVDSQHESPEGDVGNGLLLEVQRKMEKLLEPPPVKSNKALPKPIDKASKKRGGRRMRKMKERLGMTQMRKNANRMNFGELSEDVMQEHMGFDLGHMKSGSAAAGGGRIRANVVDQKTRVKMSQKLQRQMEKQRAMVAGGTSTIKRQTSGTASSVTFTPVQGLEIVNPAMQQDNNAANGTSTSTYFSSNASFLNINRMDL